MKLQNKALETILNNRAAVIQNVSVRTLDLKNEY